MTFQIEIEHIYKCWDTSPKHIISGDNALITVTVKQPKKHPTALKSEQEKKTEKYFAAISILSPIWQSFKYSSNQKYWRTPFLNIFLNVQYSHFEKVFSQ